MSRPRDERQKDPFRPPLEEIIDMGRNYLLGRDGDSANALLAAAGYTFSLLLRQLATLLRALLAALLESPPISRSA